jgi:hypothetical protein
MKPSRLALAAVFMTGSALAFGACSSYQPTSPSPASTTAETTPLPSPSPAPQLPPSFARYRVTFESVWSASTHPQDFPRFPHFSGLIGGTHASGVTFWRVGQLSTEGIRQMAERGSKTELQSEIEAAIGRGLAQHVLSGGSIDLSPATITLEFDISSTHPLVTLVSMVAPSPDWFVGVSGLALFDNEAWKDSITMDLFPHDAGTDSGATFSSPDQETIPRQSIARITGFPFLNNGVISPLGKFRFERIQ